MTTVEQILLEIEDAIESGTSLMMDDLTPEAQAALKEAGECPLPWAKDLDA